MEQFIFAGKQRDKWFEYFKKIDEIIKLIEPI